MCNIPDYIDFPTEGNDDFDFYTYDDPAFYRYNDGVLEKYERFTKKYSVVPSHIIPNVSQLRCDKEAFKCSYFKALLSR